MKHLVDCWNCFGLGFIGEFGEHICLECDGTGILEEEVAKEEIEENERIIRLMFGRD